MTKVIFPAGNTKLQDGTSTTGVEDYKEFWYSLVGLDGIGQSFDGNGPAASSWSATAGRRCARSPCRSSAPNLRGRTAARHTRRCRRSARVRPIPAEEPPYQPLVPCDTQALPNFNGPLSQGPADGSGRDDPERAATKAG